MVSKVNSLTRSLPAVCRAITGQKGIKLVFQGPPRTDGKTIYSNPLPLDANEREVAIIEGDLDHECAHILYTNFGFSESKLRQTPDKIRQFVENTLNAIEDVFIERRLGDDYLGCRESLRLSVEYVIEDDKNQLPENLPPHKAVVHYIDTWGRVNVLGQSVERWLDVLSPQVEHVLGDAGRMQLDGLLSQYLFSVDSTKDSYKLTQKVIDLLGEIAESQENPKPKPPKNQSNGRQPEGRKGEGDNTPSDSDSQGEGERQDDKSASANSSNPRSGDQPNTKSDATGKPGDSSEKEKGNQPNTGAQKKDAGKDDASQSGSGSEQPDSNAVGKSAGNGRIIREMMENASPVKPLIDRSGAAKKVIKEAKARSAGGFTAGETMSDAQLVQSRERYHRIVDAIRGEVHELQRRIVAEYQTMTRRRQMVTDSGRLDGRRLHRAVLGDRRVYRQKVKRKMPYPAVSIVLDHSGSMNGSKLMLAKQALIAVAEANEQINVPTELLAYSGSSSSKNTVVLKSFEQSLQMAHGAIGGLAAGGGTPTASGLWNAGIRLAGRKEQRKLIFLVTDGIPNNNAAASEVADLITASGIELYGLGIGTDMVSQFCPRYAVITNISHLATAVLDALRSRLMAVA